MFEKSLHLGHRFFFALRPPVVQARQIIHELARYAGGGRMMLAHRLHVTLDILDDFATWPDQIAAALIAAGGKVAAAPFTMVLERVSGGSDTVALKPRYKIPLLDQLLREIAGARASEGLQRRAGYKPSPHMTLAYRDGVPFSQMIAPLKWWADEIVLIHSLLGQTRHEVLGRWTLKGVEDPQLSLF